MKKLINEIEHTIDLAIDSFDGFIGSIGSVIIIVGLIEIGELVADFILKLFLK